MATYYMYILILYTRREQASSSHVYNWRQRPMFIDDSVSTCRIGKDERICTHFFSVSGSLSLSLSLGIDIIRINNIYDD